MNAQVVNSDDSAKKADEEVIQLSPFIVDASKDKGYFTNETLAGGRLKSNLSDLATSVQVVTEEFLKDIGATSMDEILLYATNADASGRGSNFIDGEQSSTLELNNSASRTNPADSNSLRGLGSATRTVDYYQTSIPFDSYISGRVDINRGANSFLFGLGSPGGILNSSTDQASLNKDSTKVDTQVSTEDFEANYSWRASLNFNKVLLKNKLALRAATLVDNQTYTQKPAMKDTQRSYATITYKPIKNITLRASYEKGRIDANPPNQLAPLENLSGFLNDPRGIVYPITAANPTGRMWIDPIKAINLNSIVPAANVAAYNYFGLSNSGAVITTINNSTGAPVGNGWALVYDGTETAAGVPTRAFALTNRGTWIAGNSVFDTDNNYIRGSKNAAFTGPPGVGQYASSLGLAQYTNWSDRGLADYSLFDWRTTLLSGGLDNYHDKFDRKNVELEAVSDRGNFGINIGYDSEHYKRDNYVAMGSPKLSFDVNKTLPIGANPLFGPENPNFGRLFIQTGTPARTYANTDRETIRGTAYGKFDFQEKFKSGMLKWFGNHTVTLLADRTENSGSNIGYTLGSDGNDVGFYVNSTDVQGNDRRTKAIIYVGPQQLDAWTNPNFSIADFKLTSTPGNLAISSMDGTQQIPVAFWNAGNPATDLNINTVAGDERMDVGSFTNLMRAQNAKLEKTVITSEALNLQSFLLDNHLVANLGWRKDNVKYQLNASPLKDAENVSLVTPDVFNLDAIPVRDTSARNFAYGLVLKVPSRWLPDGHGVSMHYGSSSNFLPSADGYDIDGVLTPASGGSTKDYGVTWSLGAKLSIRFNLYTGNSTNVGGSAGTGAGFGYGVVAAQMGMNNLLNMRAELDQWDWNMDGQYDNPLADVTGPNGVPDGVIDLYSARNPMTLTELHALYKSFDEFVTPFMKEVTHYSFTPSTVSGANNSKNTLGSDLYYVLKDTYDLEAKGKEIEITYNPTRNWRIAFNATQQSSQYANSYARLLDFGLRYTEAINRVDPKFEFYNRSSNFLEANPGYQPTKYATNSLYGGFWGNTYGGQLYYYNKALQGQNDPKVREYRANFITNYTFSEGRLKGVNIGGGYRYQSAGAVGFGLATDPDTGIPYPDPNNAYKNAPTTAVDFWAGYDRKIFRGKVGWKIQLNVRNAFASTDPLVAQYEPDGSIARAAVPAARQILLRNTFSF